MIRYQGYSKKGNKLGTPKTDAEREQIDKCISGVLWEVLK